MPRKKILIVDDEKQVRRCLALALESPLCEIDQAENGLKAMESLRAGTYDLLITDYAMPRMNGLQLTRAVKRQYPLLPVLIVSGNGPEQELIKAGASALLKKPFNLIELKNMVQALLLDKQVFEIEKRCPSPRP